MDKNELEQKKLELEIKELRKPFYCKSNYLIIIPTLVLAVFSIVISSKSRIFDVKNENLKLEKNILTNDIAHFQHKRDSIQESFESMVDSISWLKNAVKTKEFELTQNYNEKSRLIIDKLRVENKTEEIIRYYKGQLDSLTKLVIKRKALDDAISDEEGNFILTEDGKYLLFEGKSLTFGAKPVTADRTDITVDSEK